MPINRDLNVDPYFDDFDLEKQYYRVLFKPSYAVQARELTQLQTILQNQIEQFGDNIFKEGSIVKGCNFTELNDLQYVKVTDKAGFDPTSYVGFEDTVEIAGEIFTRDNAYELRGDSSRVSARVIAATRGFETRNPDLNTFYINYTNTSVAGNKLFQSGESLEIYKITTTFDGTGTNVVETLVETIDVTTFSAAVGNSFGLKSAPGIIFQRGHFLYSPEQLVIVSKYSNIPDNVSVGFIVEERIINAFQDDSLYDNANGSFNQNAPGADRLKLIPVLTAIETNVADGDTTFFTLSRYSNGNAVLLRDVSQYNALGEEMARRTFEESGDYIVKDFKTKVIRRDNNLKASVSSGLAYVKGYRVENLAEVILDIDDIDENSYDERTNQAISFNYGSYINVVDTVSSGVVDIGSTSTVTLKQNSTSIGTARVKNVTPDKIFLYDIRMNASRLIGEVNYIEGSSGRISIANNSIVNETNIGSMVFDTGAISLRSMSDISLPIRVQKGSQAAGNTFVISPDEPLREDFNLSNDDILFVDGTNQKINVQEVSISGNNELVVVLESDAASGGTIYYNKRFNSADPFTKISDDLFVKCTFANTDISSPSKFNLGFPDVYEIVSITDANGDDVTSSFKLRTNQRDNYYDHSYIEFIPGRTAPADGLITVSMKAFKINAFSGREYFFNVNSYPANVPKNKIPLFRSSSGRVYNLRDCVDFRPYVQPLSPADYTNAATLGTAPTVSDSTTGVNIAPVFETNGGLFEIITPAADQFAQVDYEYFFNRTDAVTLDSYGSIRVIKGTETELSSPPTITGDQIKIADIFVPGIPALTPEEASTRETNQYGVRVTSKGTKSYRMKDIQNLERKVDALKYYVLLSTLEAETKNLNIVDENGLSRFKNGIIVDPFDDLNIANVEDTEFNAALDFTEKSLMAPVKTYPLNMKYNASSSASIFPSTANAIAGTLSRNQDISIINQPYATDFRNCASNFYSYRGVGSLDPEYDALYDVTTNPVSIDIDLVTPLSQFADAINEVVPLTATSREVLNTVRNGTTRQQTGNQITTTTTFTDTVRETFNILQISGEQISETPVGDFVSNINFNPFMAPREVNVYMSGLRPNTRHYFFFDEVDVNQFVAPGDDVDSAAEVHRNGNFGDPITSDENGVITAVFDIPAETFFVGDRKLEIVDVNVYSSIESGSTSYGTVTYRAYNFSIENSSLTASTRSPTQFIEQTVSERNVTRRVVNVEQVREDRDGRDHEDPLAQTFFVKRGMGRGTDTVFASKVDLYFKRKSSTYGVTVELRETINGYPSYQNVPFSRVHLTPDQVSVSDDASLETAVIFPAPVRLDAEKEYAIVVLPDASNPDYLIFISKVGGTDLTPGDNQGKSIVQDWGDGVLFTSTNNRAWKSYQDEDIKFTLYRHNFNSNAGTIELINDDHEFLTTENNIGRFTGGEIVYKLESRNSSTANTVSTTVGSNEITGSGLSNTYEAGNYIILDDGSTNKQIFKINNVTATTITADRPAYFEATVEAYPVTLGTISYYNFRYPTELILEKSSATATKKFAAGDTIYGFDSGTEATIVSVDNKELSYIQPIIYRTNDSITRTNLSGTFVNPSLTTSTYNKDMVFNDKTVFTKNGVVVFSKSNDIDREKGLKLTVSMTNGSNVTSSPFIDIQTSSILAYQWKITDSSETTAKYISKTIELSENLDAEDMQVYVTAYRPNGTSVKVFIKPQAAYDASAFSTNDWIELEITQGVNLYSSLSNYYDFKEFVYAVPESAKTNGILTYTNDLSQTFEGYRRFAIKIELHSEDIFKAPRLLDYRGIALT